MSLDMAMAKENMILRVKIKKLTEKIDMYDTLVDSLSNLIKTKSPEQMYLVNEIIKCVKKL